MSNSTSSTPRVVVIGGGTGTHTVLKGLVAYADRISLSAIVSMADSGGSTGRLRDAFGVLPVGDARMALTALAAGESEREALLRELFLYRFGKGEGLAGHNIGNLLLTALADMLGSEAAAVRAAGEILRVDGEVIPVTADNVHLVATYDNGESVVGEAALDEPPPHLRPRRVTALTTTPRATVTPAAASAIRGADLVVLGPGDLYSSVLANFAVEGVSEAFERNTGRVVYVCNLMERPGQTCGMSAAAHVAEVERYTGRRVDAVLLNTAPLPSDLLAHYRDTDGTAPIADDIADTRAHRADLLERAAVSTDAADTVSRSLLRHDPARVAACLMQHLTTGGGEHALRGGL